MRSEESGGWRQRILLAAAVVVLLVAGVLAWRELSSGPRYNVAAERMFKCAECGHVFEYTIKMGDIAPIECKYCDKQAGWPTEKCYWTKGEDGEWKAKLEPTYVILKRAMGIDEDTYCPDCGHKVVGHNPKPPQELMDAARAEAGQ